MKKLILTITSILLGFGGFAQSLTTFDAFNFDVGDEIQTFYGYEIWGIVPDITHTLSVFTTEKYVDRIDYGDSILYKVFIVIDSAVGCL